MAAKPPIPHRRVPPPPQPVTGVLAAGAQATWAPPPPPPRSRAALEHSPQVDLAKLLARRPPPPPAPRRPSATVTSNPSSQNPLPPAIPSNRLLASTVSPIPPPINLASKPVAVTPLSTVEIFKPEEATPFNKLSISCLQCRNFSRADAHAALFPRHAVLSLDDLARNLAEPFDNDFDNARTLFTWLHYNIIYDVDAFFSGNLQPATAEATLLSGSAVCEGYAVLFEHLADIIGLQCHKVSGHGKGYGIEPLSENDPIPEMTNNHAWNCIMLEGEWHLIDACWGAGALTGTTWHSKLNPTWFITPPIEFGTKHFPEDPSFQLTPEETTWEEYITAAPGPTLTSDFAVLDLHPLRIEPATNHIIEKRYTKFSVSKRCEHMSTADLDNYVFALTTTNKDFTPLSFNGQEGAWTATIFTPRNGTVMLCTVDTVNNKDAKGLGVAGFSKAKGRKAMTFKGLATWTIIHL